MLCLVHVKIKSLVEIRTMWRKSWKFVCRKVLMWWKVKSSKKKFETKLGLKLVSNFCCMSLFIIPNFFFKLLTFLSHQNFFTHLNFLLLLTLSSVDWTRENLPPTPLATPEPMAAKEKGYTSSSNKIVVFKHCKHLHTGNTTRTGSFRPPLFHIISTAPIVRLLSRRSRPVPCAAAAMGSSDSQAPLLLPRGSHRKEEEEEEYAAAGKVRGCCGGDGEGGWWREAIAEAGRLASLAAPMIVVALLQLMMQLISTVMVGHLGEVALAGAAIANSLTNVSGFSVLVSALFPSIIFFYPSVRETTPSRDRMGFTSCPVAVAVWWLASRAAASEVLVEMPRTTIRHVVLHRWSNARNILINAPKVGRTRAGLVIAYANPNPCALFSNGRLTFVALICVNCCFGFWLLELTVFTLRCYSYLTICYSQFLTYEAKDLEASVQVHRAHWKGFSVFPNISSLYIDYKLSASSLIWDCFHMHVSSFRLWTSASSFV